MVSKESKSGHRGSPVRASSECERFVKAQPIRVRSSKVAVCQIWSGRGTLWPYAVWVSTRGVRLAGHLGNGREGRGKEEEGGETLDSGGSSYLGAAKTYDFLLFDLLGFLVLFCVFLQPKEMATPLRGPAPPEHPSLRILCGSGRTVVAEFAHFILIIPILIPISSF